MNFDHTTIVKISGLRQSGRTTKLVKLAGMFEERYMKVRIYGEPFSTYTRSALSRYEPILKYWGGSLENYVIVIDNFDYLKNGDAVIESFKSAGCRTFLISIEEGRP